jgi:hypothetical protein
MLDSNDNQIPATAGNTKGKKIMEKITVDGYSFECGADLKRAIEKTAAQHAEQLKDSSKNLETATARADALDLMLKDKNAEISALKDPSKFDAAVAERVAVSAIAQKFGVEVKGSNHDVRVATLAKVAPEIRCDGKGPDYVNAIFDLVTAQKAGGNAMVLKLDEAVKNPAGAQHIAPVTPGTKAERTSALRNSIYADERSQKINA